MKKRRFSGRSGSRRHLPRFGLKLPNSGCHGFGSHSLRMARDFHRQPNPFSGLVDSCPIRSLHDASGAVGLGRDFLAQVRGRVGRTLKNGIATPSLTGCRLDLVQTQDAMVEVGIHVHRMARVIVIGNRSEMPVWLRPGGVEAYMAQVARSAWAAIPSRRGKKIRSASGQGAGLNSFFRIIPTLPRPSASESRPRPTAPLVPIRFLAPTSRVPVGGG